MSDIPQPSGCHEVSSTQTVFCDIGLAHLEMTQVTHQVIPLRKRSQVEWNTVSERHLCNLGISHQGPVDHG